MSSVGSCGASTFKTRMRVGNREVRAHSSALSLVVLLTIALATSHLYLFVGFQRSLSVDLRQNHQRIAARGFFDKIAESFQAMVNPEDAARRKLKQMSHEARQQLEDNMKSLLAARDAARSALAASNEALTKLQAARGSAKEACIVDWAEEEAKWDASLAACAEPVVKAAGVLESNLGSLRKATDELASVANSCSADSAARAEAAAAVVAKLQNDARDNLAKEVVEASQPIDNDRQFLRSWVMSSAEAKDIYRHLELLKSEASRGADEFVKQLRDLRGAKAAEEKSRAEEEKRKAEAAAKAKADKAAAEAAAKAAAEAAAKSKAEDDSKSQGITLVVALVLAAGAFGLKLTSDPNFLGPSNPVSQIVASIGQTPKV
eukprot:TRINITY_DN27365_c0_g1_i1.p1 TRINITY_DN27365_c0_g1~~TRINITY_DN27365_c0_g1_i1.p1  ORF type:complete len:376 (+),score=103.38 TRINITY_DN27365_c0_g1_i1:30-1157(+)